MLRREFLSLPFVGWIAGKLGVKPITVPCRLVENTSGSPLVPKTIRVATWEITDVTDATYRHVGQYEEQEVYPGVYCLSIPFDKMEWTGRGRDSRLLRWRRLT